VAGYCEHDDERSGSGATELVVSFKYTDVSEVRTAVRYAAQYSRRLSNLQTRRRENLNLTESLNTFLGII
jgi:hypothetical protein